MTQPTDLTGQIVTSAEHAENAVLPAIREVHTDPARACPSTDGLPDALTRPNSGKSAAQWAYERIILYIHNFEKQLDRDHEVGMGFTGGDAGVIRIEGLGFYEPDIITFYGTDGNGNRTQLIQHVSQLNVMLQASPKQIDQDEPNRIGFQLVKELAGNAAATP